MDWNTHNESLEIAWRFFNVFSRLSLASDEPVGSYGWWSGLVSTHFTTSPETRSWVCHEALGAKDVNPTSAGWIRIIQLVDVSEEYPELQIWSVNSTIDSFFFWGGPEIQHRFKEMLNAWLGNSKVAFYGSNTQGTEIIKDAIEALKNSHRAWPDKITQNYQVQQPAGPRSQMGYDP